MDPSCLVPSVQADCGVIVCGKFSGHKLAPFVPTEYCINITAYLNVFADHVHPFFFFYLWYWLFKGIIFLFFICHYTLISVTYCCPGNVSFRTRQDSSLLLKAKTLQLCCTKSWLDVSCLCSSDSFPVSCVSDCNIQTFSMCHLCKNKSLTFCCYVLSSHFT